MANINFTRLFTTLGYLCGGLNEVNTFVGTTIPARGTTLVNQFEGSTVYTPLVSTVPTTEPQAQAANSVWVNMLASFAQSAIIEEVNASNPSAGSGFASCLTELVRQMTINSQTLQAAQCGETTTSIGSPTGDEAFVFGLVEGVTGVTSDYIIPDVMLMTCTQDSSHGATAYQEVFTIAGYPAVSPTTNYEYGTSTFGAGVNTTTTATDPSFQGGVVTDPGFAQWGTGPSANTPTAWTIYSGVAGTNVFKATSDPRNTGAFSLSLVGDGSTVVKVRQAVSLTPGTTYAMNYRVYMKTDESSHWQVSLSLTNSAGTAVSGPASYSNVLTSASSASLSGSWANVYNANFVAPAIIPAGGLFLEIRLCLNGSLTSAAQAGANAYVDYISMIPETALYTGGPSLVIFSGQTAAVQGDARTATVTFSTGTINGSLLRGIDRLTGGLAQYAPVLIPTTTGSPSQSNSLVT